MIPWRFNDDSDCFGMIVQGLETMKLCGLWARAGMNKSRVEAPGPI